MESNVFVTKMQIINVIQSDPPKCHWNGLEHKHWASTLPNNFPTLRLEFNGIKYICDKNANNKHDPKWSPKMSLKWSWT
jgi:hypothetical protein